MKYILTLLLLLAAPQLQAAFTVTPTPLFESVGIVTTYANSSATAVVEYRESGGSWKNAYPLVWDPNTSQFAGSIVNLEEETTYDVRVTFFLSGVQDDQETASFTTWTSNPPIAPGKTYAITDIYNPATDTQLVIPQTMSGTATGWTKIVGDGTTVIDAGYLTDHAVVIASWGHHIILENLIIRGGKRNGIKTYRSHNIRIINCDIAGWGRQPESAPRSNGRWYEAGASNPINYDSAIYLQQTGQSVVERCYVHDPRSTANAWSDAAGSNHPNGTNAFYANGKHDSIDRRGQIVLRHNDFIGSDAKRWNDVIEGQDNGSIDGAFVRDSDIYGNYLAFGNDDGTEIDGGQINVKFYRNRVEGTYTGVSVAPTMTGPSYVFQNIFSNLGDIHGKKNTNIKAGFAKPPIPSPFYAFNNTGYNSALGIGGSSGKYRATTRNNLFYTRSSWTGAKWGISDSYADLLSSYDYDLLANSAIGTGQIKYGTLTNAATGMETNGIRTQLPTFMALADGDFRLTSGSAGVNQGQTLANFSDGYLGSAPDMGALESGGTSMLPHRPIDQRTDVQEVQLGYIAGDQSSAQFVNVSNPGAAIGYKILKNDAFDWLIVSPASGTLPAGGSLPLTVSIDPALAPLRTPASYNSNAPDGLVRGAFLIKLDNGYSLPVSVYGRETLPVVTINCGTSAVGAWASDQASNYTTDGGVTSTSTSIDLSGVTNPAPEAVYQSVRWGSGTTPVTQTINKLIPNAAYTVRLHFAEIGSTSQSIGSRLFDVNINGGPVELDGYDIFSAAGGGYKAVVEEFTATTDGFGAISIEFSNQNASPICSGIELILNPLGGEPEAVIPEADTYVRSGSYAGTNYGTETGLAVKGSGGNYTRISYLRFPLPGAGSFTTAVLHLKVTAIGGEGAGPRTVEIRQLTNDSWTETGTNWNNRPSSTGTLIATIDAGTVDQEYSIDVSTFVIQEAAGDGTVSFVLVQPSSVDKYIGFGSRENAGNEPILQFQ